MQLAIYQILKNTTWQSIHGYTCFVTTLQTPKGAQNPFHTCGKNSGRTQLKCIHKILKQRAEGTLRTFSVKSVEKN